MIVVDRKTKKEVKVGDIVTDFRGEKRKVQCLSPEALKVTVARPNDTRQFACQEYYLSVFGLEVKGAKQYKGL